MDNKNNLFPVLILLCELILIFLISLFVNQLFTDHSVLLAVTVSGGGMVFLYSVLHFRQERRQNKNLMQVASILDAIADDLSADFHLLNKDPALGEFYKQIELFRDKLRRKEENRQQIFSLVDSIAVNIEIEKLLEDLMPKLMDLSGSNCIAFYIANNVTNRLEIKSSMGFNKNLYSEFDLTIGEGLIGGAVRSKETKIIRDIPDDTVYAIRSVLGKIKPKSIMVVPVFNQDHLLGALALASIYDYTQTQLEMVDLMKYYIGAAISNGLAYEQTKRLTNELKFQNKLIQNLNDELEKSVQERTNLMNAVLDSIRNEAIFALDTDYKILAWNISAEETLGHKADDVIGKQIDSIFPEESVREGIIPELFEKAAKNGSSSVNSWWRKNKSEKVFIEMQVFARRDENGKPIGFTAVTRDITDYPKLWIFNIEADVFKEILRHSKKAIIYAEAGGRIIFANTAATAMLGTDDISGRDIGDFFEDPNEFRTRAAISRYAFDAERWRQSLKNSGSPVNISLSALLAPETYEKMILVCIEP